MWFNIIIGYLIIINIVTMIRMYWDMKEFIKIKSNNMNMIYLILSIIGGFVGVLVTSQMFGFKRDEKIIKKWIPIIVFLEVAIGLTIFAKIQGII